MKPKVIFWARPTRGAASQRAAVIDIKGIEEVTPRISGECKKEPQASFWARLKDEWKKVEAETEAETKRLEKKF